jgi:large subunit ribosomal protein L24
MHIRKDDVVEVIAGDDAEVGRGRRVLRVLHEEGKLVVEGVNLVYKHLKPNRRNMQGGRLSKEMPIDVSNVLLYCPNCRRGRRVGHRYAADGHKSRYCKKCGHDLGALSKPRAKYARR